jgi:hypothetical protein
MEVSPEDDMWQLEARGAEWAWCARTRATPPRNRPLHIGCMLVLGCVYVGGWPIFFGRVGCFEIFLAWICFTPCLIVLFAYVFLIIKHVSFKTYKQQNLRNSLVISPIQSSVFQINVFYARFWRLKLCIKDRQH